jgi:hypothetical protein
MLAAHRDDSWVTAGLVIGILFEELMRRCGEARCCTPPTRLGEAGGREFVRFGAWAGYALLGYRMLTSKKRRRR